MPDEHFSPKVKTHMILQFLDTRELKKTPSHADAYRLAEEKYRVWMSQQGQREKDQRRACTMYGRCECGHTHAYARYRSEGHGRECPFSPLYYPGDPDNPPGWIALAAGDKEAGQGTGQGLERAGSSGAAKRRTPLNCVNKHLMDRAYGSPEEGGWWYDTGRFIKYLGTAFGPRRRPGAPGSPRRPRGPREPRLCPLCRRSTAPAS